MIHLILALTIITPYVFIAGATILTMIVLTLVFDFGMMLLLGMTAVIFIIIVILTNMCTMVYQL